MTPEKVREDQVSILEEIFSAGEIARQNVDLARTERNKMHLALVVAEGQVTEAKAALAAAVGILLAALESVDFAWLGIDNPPRAEAFSIEEIKRETVLNRLDLRRSLAQYAAAEAALQLEIAKQYPDINIGPGYTYEEKHSFFTLGLSTTIPVFNRNEGPIAEAEAEPPKAVWRSAQRSAWLCSASARVHLAPKEFEVLRLLVIHQGKPVTHKRLLQTAWGPDHGGETESLRVVISQLRKKIEKDPTHPIYILTEPWMGYRFQSPDMPSQKH